MEPGDSLLVPLIGRTPVLAVSSKERATTTLLLVHLATIVEQLAFSASVLISKRSVSDHHLNQVVFAIYRDTVAFLFLSPLAYVLERKTRPPVTLPIAGFFLACAATSVFGGQLLLLRGLSLATPSAYAITTTLSPMFTFLIAITLGLEILEWRSGMGGSSSSVLL
ncbi:hypothetical protein Mapa_014294 [Marchantia paleacea]|nr:hypothetical protein Mapa_014294 [Marchantia paleacea]